MHYTIQCSSKITKFNETGRCLIKISSYFNHTHTLLHSFTISARKEKNDTHGKSNWFGSGVVPNNSHAKLINRKVWTWTSAWKQKRATKQYSAGDSTSTIVKIENKYYNTETWVVGQFCLGVRMSAQRYPCDWLSLIYNRPEFTFGCDRNFTVQQQPLTYFTVRMLCIIMYTSRLHNHSHSAKVFISILILPAGDGTFSTFRKVNRL